ncbi:MAG: efflux RND transporter periplasmic adaptor subunit [Acidobacteriia bacterium]|nr:efflux RND transporter periplasmic adaptor subunit [Terriglobia bacterium]
MLRKTLIDFLVLSLVAVGLVVWLCSCSGKTAQEAEPMVTVQAVRVRRAEIQQRVPGKAILFPLHQASIVPKISAPVSKFLVNRGEHVRAGQLLAVLENRDLAAAVAENKGAYEQAQANYEGTMASSLPEQIQKSELDVKNANAALHAAQQLYDSSKKLYEQGALSKMQLNQAEVGLTQSQTQLQIAEQQLQKLQSVGQAAQLKAAQGQLAAAKGRYESAKAQFAYSEIRSPISGVVTDRPLYPGEMASGGTPLITVMDISQVIARAHLPESQAALLKVDDAAELSVAGGDKGISGRVTVVSPALDLNSTTVEVWVQALNPGDQLRPGTTANLTLVPRKVPNTLVIPRAALLTEPDQTTSVMVVGPDDRAHQREVQTGIEEGNEVQVIKGLGEGELVVTTGAYGLPDNVKVNVGKPGDHAPR